MLNANEKQKMEAAVSGLDKIAEMIDGFDDLRVSIRHARFCANMMLTSTNDEDMEYWGLETMRNLRGIHKEIKKRYAAFKGVQ